MSATELLWRVYEWLPFGFLLDFMIFQTALRVQYRRKHGR